MIWRVTKDERAAEGRIRLMAHGHELRIVVSHPERGETLMWSCLYRSEQADELRVASAGTLADFERHGWNLAASDSRPQ